MEQGEDKARLKYTGEGESFIGFYRGAPLPLKMGMRRTMLPQDFVSIQPRNVRPLLRGLNFQGGIGFR